jgi:glucose-1-phosphatase
MALPTLVIFDMDEVLCHYEVGKRWRYLAELANTTARDVRAALWDSGFEEQADAGGYTDTKEYLVEFAKRLGYPINRQQWLDARRIAMAPNTEVLDIARAIKRQAALAIYTNNGPMVKGNIHSLIPETAPIFDLQFCSYEFGTKKPDPESFLRLLKHLQREPAECWFIDDKLSNVEGARLAGLQGHHYRHANLLANEAVALGFQL